MSTEPTQTPVAKRTHKKSRNGCLQCKQRKVKCDERRPLCQNCQRHFHNIEKCDFPPIPPGQRVIVQVRPQILPTSKTAKLKLPDVLIDPGSGIDPFNSHPDSNVPEIQLFLHHCKYLDHSDACITPSSIFNRYLDFSNFALKSFPVHLGHDSKPFQQSWWSMASDDPVLFHATLQLSALDLGARRSEGNPPTNSNMILHRECIRLLRQRVEHPKLGTSDQTIGAVLFLTTVEFQRGNFKMVKMHVDGLKQMVKLRGGLEAIRATNSLLANVIFGITVTVMCESQFLPETSICTLPPEDPVFLEPNQHLFSFQNASLSYEHAKALSILRYMTRQAELHWPSNAAPDKCSDILLRVLALPYPIEEGKLVASVSESTKLAAFTLCVLPWRHDYPSPELMLNTFIHKLKISLGDMLEVAPTTHPLLPWLLSVGALIALPVERHWFIGHLINVVTDMKIETWLEMKPHLVKVLWLEAFCETPFKELFEEAMKKKNVIDELDLW